MNLCQCAITLKKNFENYNSPIDLNVKKFSEKIHDIFYKAN